MGWIRLPVRQPLNGHNCTTARMGGFTPQQLGEG